MPDASTEEGATHRSMVVLRGVLGMFGGATKKGEKCGRALAIVSCGWPRVPLQLRPGNPAAPREAHLPLLPSGPDGVRKHLPRGDRILITFASLGAGWHKTSGGNSAPHLERFEC